MPDRSPQKPSGKKPGKSLKEKRQAKKEKRGERGQAGGSPGVGTLRPSAHREYCAPIAWRVPPRHYGPWELFASLLTEGLVSRGHEVTLFADGRLGNDGSSLQCGGPGLVGGPEYRPEGGRVSACVAGLRAGV